MTVVVGQRVARRYLAVNVSLFGHSENSMHWSSTCEVISKSKEGGSSVENNGTGLKEGLPTITTLHSCTSSATHGGLLQCKSSCCVPQVCLAEVEKTMPYKLLRQRADTTELAVALPERHSVACALHVLMSV